MGGALRFYSAARRTFTPPPTVDRNGSVFTVREFFLVDHSAYDAYALLVEADGERLFYSGDLRDVGGGVKVRRAAE